MAGAKAVLVLSSQLGADDWARALCAADPELKVRVWPEVGDPGDIDVIIAWAPGSIRCPAFPTWRSSPMCHSAAPSTTASAWA